MRSLIHQLRAVRRIFTVVVLVLMFVIPSMPARAEIVFDPTVFSMLIMQKIENAYNWATEFAQDAMDYAVQLDQVLWGEEGATQTVINSAFDTLTQELVAAMNLAQADEEIKIEQQYKLAHAFSELAAQSFPANETHLCNNIVAMQGMISARHFMKYNKNKLMKMYRHIEGNSAAAIATYNGWLCGGRPDGSDGTGYSIDPSFAMADATADPNDPCKATDPLMTELYEASPWDDVYGKNEEGKVVQIVAVWPKMNAAGDSFVIDSTTPMGERRGMINIFKGGNEIIGASPTMPKGQAKANPQGATIRFAHAICTAKRTAYMDTYANTISYYMRPNCAQNKDDLTVLHCKESSKTCMQGRSAGVVFEPGMCDTDSSGYTPLSPYEIDYINKHMCFSPNYWIKAKSRGDQKYGEILSDTEACKTAYTEWETRLDGIRASYVEALSGLQQLSSCWPDTGVQAPVKQSE